MPPSWPYARDVESHARFAPPSPWIVTGAVRPTRLQCLSPIPVTSFKTWTPRSKLRSISWHCKRQGATSRLSPPNVAVFHPFHTSPVRSHRQFQAPYAARSTYVGIAATLVLHRPDPLERTVWTPGRNRCLPQARGPHGSALGGVR